MIYVIGSGPAGVACAMALLDQGLDVQMLDAGISLDESRQAAVQRMASTDPEQWGASDLASLKGNVEATPEGIPQKKAFGSNFPYQDTEHFVPVSRQGVYVLPSLARGGLSTVWGAAVLPFRADEMKDWPFALADLEPHYQAVLKFLPLSAASDDLAALFPLHTSSPEDLQPSRQAACILERLTKNRSALQNQGVHFGRARLAVRGQTSNGQKGCVYCGQCLYGCPYGCIYSSDQTLEHLQKRQGFLYQNNVVVQRVKETSVGVQVEALDRLTRKPLSFSGERVYIAAGILPTTQILLDSLGAYDKPLSMPYSQHFMFPVLTFGSETDIARERLYTLSQIFLEVMNPQISPDMIHLQLYTYNDLYASALDASMAGPLFRIMPAARDWVLSKLGVIQGYLHSKYSTPIELMLKRPSAGQPGELLLRGTPSPTARLQVRRLMRKLSRISRWVGVAPLPPWMKMSPPGQGFHNVGTFPMRENPKPFESDRWGRPHGFKRIHAVDASVLPSAPATTITLSVMANAHRIGSSRVYF